MHFHEAYWKSLIIVQFGEITKNARDTHLGVNSKSNLFHTVDKASTRTKGV